MTSSDEDRGREDLIKAILRVLPIDPERGDAVVGFDGGPGAMYPVWGDPEEVARRILDALDSAYTDRDMQAEHEYDRAVDWEEGGGF
jgi:hypothetical protein